MIMIPLYIVLRASIANDVPMKCLGICTCLQYSGMYDGEARAKHHLQCFLHAS